MSKSLLLENTLSQQELEEIISMYQNNISLRQIAEKTKHSRSSLSPMLERLGVKTTFGNHYRKYFFDFDYFEKIDNSNKAYWLGFLYADGCIQKYVEGRGEQEFQLTLAQEDEEIIKKLKEDLKSTYPIRYDTSKNKKNKNHQVQVIYRLRSQKTVDDLKRLGCIENKSLILEFPTEEQVPKKFIWDFIRGYFDGDGSISSYNGEFHINIVGTENFIKELFKVIGKGSIFPDKRKDNSWYLTINGNLQIVDFCKFLYNDGKAERYLERKFKKYQELNNKYGESQG